MYSNISQILLLYKTWLYYNKFDYSKALGVCNRCIKIPQCGCMEHGLNDGAFYVQKHITPCTVVITSMLVRDKPLGVPASMKRVYWTANITPDHFVLHALPISKRLHVRSFSFEAFARNGLCQNKWQIRYGEGNMINFRQDIFVAIHSIQKLTPKLRYFGL